MVLARPALAIHRRAFLRSSLATLGSSALLSCERAPGLGEGGPLRVAAGIDRYNTSIGRFTFTTSHPNVHIAEPAVKPDDAFRAQPWLFEQWSYEGSGRYVARLRNGVRFHDGSLLDADAFIASAKRFVATRDFVGLDPESLRRIDDGTVAFESLTGSAAMVKSMTHPAVSLLLANGQESTTPVGTGPYKLVRYEPRREIEVERFDDYWGPKPAIERVVFRFVADSQARLTALLGGEVDVISDVTPEMFLGLDPDEPSVVVRKSRPMRYIAMFCNRRGEPPYDKMSDVRVRRAVAMAIDRAAIAKVMYGGHARPSRGILPDWMFGLGDETPRGFELDREKAASLLDEAGWRLDANGVREKDGTPFDLRIVSAYPNASSVKPIPEMLEQMLRLIGARTEIIEVEDSQLYYTGYADRGLGDLFLEMGGNAVADPTFLLYNTYHSSSPWPSYRRSAPGEDVDELLEAAREEPDAEAIVGLVREAHRRIVDEHVASIPILMVPVFLFTKPNIVLEPFESLDWVNFGAAQQTA